MSSVVLLPVLLRVILPLLVGGELNRAESRTRSCGA